MAKVLFDGTVRIAMENGGIGGECVHTPQTPQKAWAALKIAKQLARSRVQMLHRS